ncbi:glycosyltransferase [Olleya sp. Bg11-27]|uniref:glycosyltransferase n=1 Tax=Olleya sp. Bg11-27 TaxID=2058135 RepID=UPI000C31409F|nr:glycosyltransferase [Olleya sp. Bg11-27]AUC75833.1 glycosyltransferase [Olleya sp. Bg11-27]
MRVLQLIDSLEAGGAERVAVNYANGLLNQIDGSYLCTTRAEGLLKHSLKKEVGYLYLKRTKTIDFKAIRTLRKFININGITIIHAHASSYFLATLIKVLNPKLKLIWHDHYGKSEFLHERSIGVLTQCSRFFNHVFSVNSKLENWAKINLKVKSVRYLPNYAVVNDSQLITNLRGEAGKRMVCLANLRPQKDHLNVLHAFKLVVAYYPDWTLHLIGKDFEDAYSKHISSFIIEAGLEQQVFLYGSCMDTTAILKRCDIGILSSRSEGLPLALLEYGLSDLAVVATDVGECNRVIKNEVTGLLVASQNYKCLSEALLVFIEDINLRAACSQGLNSHIKTCFSENTTIDTIVKTYSLL